MIQFLITREKQAGGRFENRPIDIEKQEKSTGLDHVVVCGKVNVGGAIMS
jgi:hypothetical protein